ncbi:MAG: hypothetical protein JWQ50_3938 [Caballeronia mineralivorans]|jgi:hypothetical protein|nr:hypothetical protein [Caballeronia mineralivorans]
MRRVLVAAPARVAEVAPREATALAKAEPEWERRMQTGVTGSPSGASGSSTMEITSDDSQKPMKKGGKDSPVPGETKKAN